MEKKKVTLVIPMYYEEKVAEECYKRVVNRWKEINKNYSEKELNKYKNKKLGMFEWYKLFNSFIIKINNL